MGPLTLPLLHYDISFFELSLRSLRISICCVVFCEHNEHGRLCKTCKTYLRFYCHCVHVSTLTLAFSAQWVASLAQSLDLLTLQW